MGDGETMRPSPLNVTATAFAGVVAAVVLRPTSNFEY